MLYPLELPWLDQGSVRPEAGATHRMQSSLFHVNYFIYRQKLSRDESFICTKILIWPSSCIELVYPWKVSLKIKLDSNLASKKPLK